MARHRFHSPAASPLGPPQHLLFARLALLAGVGMTLRYLKFFSHYSSEVFTSFAHAREADGKA